MSAPRHSSAGVDLLVDHPLVGAGLWLAPGLARILCPPSLSLPALPEGWLPSVRRIPVGMRGGRVEGRKALWVMMAGEAGEKWQPCWWGGP